MFGLSDDRKGIPRTVVNADLRGSIVLSTGTEPNIGHSFDAATPDYAKRSS
jgi:hypothetical protein